MARLTTYSPSPAGNSEGDRNSLMSDEHHSSDLDLTAKEPAVDVKRELSTDDENDNDNGASHDGPKSKQTRRAKKSKTSPQPAKPTRTRKDKPALPTDANWSTYDGRKRKSGVGTAGKKWTGPELETLLLAAHGPVPLACFNEAVDDRTANQCHTTWR